MSQLLTFTSVRSTVTSIALLLLVLVLTTGNVQGQGPSGTMLGHDRTITAEERKEIVDSVSALLKRMYVFPDKAQATADLMRRNLKSGKYDTCNVISSFTAVLTGDMQQLTRDKHLSVAPADAPPVGSDSAATSEERRRSRFEFGKSVNFGFQKAEILTWNIGYLNLKSFFLADVAAPTAIAAMNLLANCRALIIDLRENDGGEPSMIQLISSYFFNEPVHLNNFFDRRTGDTSQFWTQLQVVGPRMANTPIYVLTSQNSFSAAEEFAYNLKQLKRARIIGETTGGGAHPNDFIHFPNLKITVSVAWGRAFNPITGTNWEGVGVEPDIKVSADKSLAVAQLLILDSLKASETDSIEQKLLSWSIQTLVSDTLRYHLTPSQMSEYAGKFGPRKISAVDGQVLYQRENGPTVPLIPIAADLFQHSKSKFFRIRFLRNQNGEIDRLMGLYPDRQEAPAQKEI